MSHLLISPDAPFAVRAATTAVLALHISAGCTGIASGFAAVLLKKGRRGHQVAGTIFFVSMLTMSAIGAVVSPMLSDRISSAMGMLTLYMVATGWMTMQRRAGQIGRFEVLAAASAFAIAAYLMILGVIGQADPKGLVDGTQPYSLGYAFGTLAMLAAALDLRMIRKGGVSGAQRLARHLWRMCFALFVASGSLFLGQPQVFPVPLRNSPLLIGLALAPLAFLIFWMIRVRWPRRLSLSRPTAILQAAE
jgi:uncharacterized membrane protein